MKTIIQMVETGQAILWSQLYSFRLQLYSCRNGIWKIPLFHPQNVIFWYRNASDVHPMVITFAIFPNFFGWYYCSCSWLLLLMAVIGPSKIGLFDFYCNLGSRQIHVSDVLSEFVLWSSHIIMTHLSYRWVLIFALCLIMVRVGRAARVNSTQWKL